MAGREDVYQDAMNKGHSAAWDQRWDLAAEHYQKAVEVKPGSSQAVNNLGLAYYQQQKYAEAQACYDQSAKMSPGDPLPIEKLAEIFERTGKIKEAAEKSMQAADLYLKLKDADKAIENWARITQLIPEHLKAHSRLALVHERLGRKEQAIREYISVAALLQDVGQIGEAVKAVDKAVAIDPKNPEAKQAKELVKANKTLPKPMRKRGATGPLRMAAVREMSEVPPEVARMAKEGPDPIAEARQKALTAMAGLLFDVSSDDVDGDTTARSGLRGVFGRTKDGDLSKISLHLGAAIDHQTRAEDERAVKELLKAMKQGLEYPAAYFNLGLLLYKLENFEESQPYLARSVNHPDFALAARLLIADFMKERGRFQEAVIEYLEALKEADAAVVSPAEADSLREQYEPLIEGIDQENDEKLLQLCQNIEDLLLRSNWRKHLTDARQQLPGGSPPMPLAQILTEAKNAEIVEAMGRINQIARAGHLRSAMEEAYYLLSVAPTYLPLHIHMAELMLRMNHTKEAVTKFSVVAEAYAARGEAKRATDLLRRIVETSPMDLKARTKLIKRLSEQGQVDQAIHEYIKLADVYYRLAQLDQARTTYENALRLAQQTNADPEWSTRILKHMADIDMQRLDWRQAQRVYEQLRTLVPDDAQTRTRLIELNVRLGQENQAMVELDNYMSYLSGKARENQALKYLENLVNENQDMVSARRRLAEYYQQSSRALDAIAQWDKVAELMIVAGNTERAKEAIRAILVLNPPNAEQYRTALQKLG